MHKISNQPQTTTLHDADLFLISQTQNYYNSAWKSKKITKHDIANSFENQFRSENFKEELDTLQEIYSEYVDGRNLVFKYDQASKKIILLDNGSVNASIDPTDFIYDGMIESVSFSNPNLLVQIKTSTGSKTIKVDISKVNTLQAGNGIEINGRTISIKDHQHYLSSIVNVKDLSNEYSNVYHNHDGRYLVSGDYLSVTALEGYATQKWVEEKNYLTSHQSLENYYDKNQVDKQLEKYQLSGNYLSNNALDGYATENWVKDQHYISSHQSLDNYYDKDQTDEILNGYALSNHNHDERYSRLDHKHEITDIDDFPVNISYFKNDVGYLSSHQSLDNYYDKNQVDNLLDGYALSDHNHDEIYWRKSQTSSANEISNALKNIKIGDFLSVNALDDLSGNWQSSWIRISAATDGLTGNVGQIAYKNSLSTSDINGYADTTYTAGEGLSITDKNEIILTASGGGGVTYDYVRRTLSSDGYCVTFIDWDD